MTEEAKLKVDCFVRVRMSGMSHEQAVQFLNEVRDKQFVSELVVSLKPMLINSIKNEIKRRYETPALT